MGAEEHPGLQRTRHVGGTDKSWQWANPMLRARKRRTKGSMVNICEHDTVSGGLICAQCIFKFDTLLHNDE